MLIAGKHSNLSGWILWRLEEDGDAKVHEGLGEVYDCLSGVIDGHGGHG